ncbi:extracellular calcium-sensing receptor-like protein [Labeo rohita]|uniref:Extracellular calcium-sensing receptor-like protein n=1 Tax=Labeo rohita TaxID=84645 RepID=A0A498L8J8_LABRO|nr:extracellular calcium-sensing receptor-like protein [Labeo rohita]
MAHSSIATGFPLTCKLCPNNLLPDDGHEFCPSCLGVQHLKEALTDPCLHCSLLPMSERQLRLAELDRSTTVKLGQLDATPPRSKKRRVSAAAGTAPPSKKKATSRSDEYSRMEENSLSKTVSVLSSEMAELKRLLQSLQPVTCASPVKTTQEDVNVQNQGAGEESLDSPCFSDLDVLSTSASDSFFNDHLDTADAAVQPSPQDAFAGHPAAEGSSEGSVQSSGQVQSSSDDTLAVLRMAIARLGLDESPAQSAQTNIFFRQPTSATSFAMPPCKDFVAEFSNALTGAGPPKRRSKIARTLASMAEADSIGMGRAPEIEQPVAALVVSPDEALRGNVRCPSAQCGRTDTLLKKAYESVAYVTRTENTICQLLLAATSTLEPANVDSSISQFLQTALLAMGHVTRELGNLTATLLAARRQVWLAQARLPEDCKKTLRDLPFVPGHLFGPNVPELLEKRVKLSEATRQLTQVQRNPTFKIPAAQNRQRYATMDHRFRQHAAPQSQPHQRPRVAEDSRVSRPPQRQLPGGPRQRPPTTSKGRTHKA